MKTHSLLALKKYGVLVMNWTNKKTIYCVLGVLLFVVIGFFIESPDALSEQAVANGSTGHYAMIVIASIVFAVCWWAGEVAPDWCTAFILQTIWVLFANMSFQTVFRSFSESTVWLVVGTFSLSAAITKTGLLKRISLNLMKVFSPTYKGQVLAMMCVGTFCAPLMPSSTAKVVLGAKLAESSSMLLNFEDNSKGRVGLFIGAWTGFGLMAPAFLSASFLSYTVLGSLPSQYSTVTWMNWFIAMIPFAIITFVGMYVAILFFYKSEKDASFSKLEILEKNKELGMVSKNERITAAILCICLVLWITEKNTGFSAGITAIIGGVLCFIFGILNSKDIQTEIPWGFIIFVGVVLNMGNIFSLTGISGWILTVIQPLVSKTNSTYVVIIFIILFTILIRFVLASQTAVITLLVSVLSPVAIVMNINPLIFGLVVYIAIPVWIAFYQNPTYLAAFAAMEGTIKHKYTFKAACCYILLAIIICIVSVPYWKMLGYIN